MRSRLNPYLNFPGSSRTAMEFYQRVFGGKLTMSTFAEFGNDDPALADKIMHALLETDDGFTLMASDTAPGMDHHPGNDIAICLSGDDAGQLRAWWTALVEGGTVSVPLERQMWGDEFGTCTDPYGVAWMVNITTPRD
ncbi:VOC family protein [Micromonospora siamensis]|uniref:PhnB protein n=1 Tax=Micromonospora siamensis TaxID=299152 RepID=A0A1C5IMU1_9ACTN|nr:VOC family protein [Micromonospora siamensis]SCG59341.1 PhnB protein [Micromonospora siamensis]